MKQNISIQDVIAVIRNPQTEKFSLSFVRATGPSAGSIKKIQSCLYGSAKKITVSKSASKALHTKSGTIPLREFDTGKPGGKYLTVLISHIIGFNSFNVIH